MTDAEPGDTAGVWAVPDSPSGSGDSEWRPPDLRAEQPADGWLVPVGQTSDEVDAAAAARVAARRASRPLRLPVPLRPLTFTDVIDGAFSVLKVRPATVALLAVVVVVPVQVLNLLVQGTGDAGISPVVSELVRADGPQGPATFIAWASWSLAYALLGALLGRLVSSWYADGDLAARQVVSEVAPRLGVLAGAWAVALLAKAASLVTFGVATPFVAALFVLIGPVVGIEGPGLAAAIRRSFELVRRRWMAITATLIGAVVIETVLQYLLTALPWMVFTAVLPEQAHGWVGFVAGTAARMVTAPAAASVPVLLYLDARVRAEGLDLQLAAAEVLDPLAVER